MGLNFNKLGFWLCSLLNDFFRYVSFCPEKKYNPIFCALVVTCHISCIPEIVWHTKSSVAFRGQLKVPLTHSRYREWEPSDVVMRLADSSRVIICIYANVCVAPHGISQPVQCQRVFTGPQRASRGGCCLSALETKAAFADVVCVVIWIENRVSHSLALRLETIASQSRDSRLLADTRTPLAITN